MSAIAKPESAPHLRAVAASQEPQPVIVRLDQVYKSLGDNQVLTGVSFEVARGEMIAIIGASGSGKS
ncbi:ATP-binding cassette domain-containing protein, partial [Acinetobacter baumannii]